MRCSFLTIAFVLAALGSHAQGEPDSGGTAPTEPSAPTEVPLDGGASLLLAAGVGFAWRKLRAGRPRPGAPRP